LSELFNRYADLAFVISLRVLRDRAEAEDLVQDVFLKLFGKNNSFDPDRGSARTWIVQFIYRRALNRRVYLARRHFYVGTDLEDSKNAKQEGAIPNLEDEIAAQVTARQLVAALEELTEQQRTTIEMHIFQGASLREVSQKMGETVENTRHHYYRGLDRLKKIVRTLGGRRKK
jgi:RNA polymerase sigma-70 factor, ECF subfamily